MSDSPRSAFTAAKTATPSPIYCTTNTDAIAYLICFHKMRYLGARRAGGNGHNVDLVVEDSDGRAEQLVREFRLGNPEPGDPRALLQVHNFLRNEISRVRAEVANVRPARVR